MWCTQLTAAGARGIIAQKNYLIFFLGLCCVVLLGVTIALAASGSNDDDASAPVGVADPKKYSYAEGTPSEVNLPPFAR